MTLKPPTRTLPKVVIKEWPMQAETEFELRTRIVELQDQIIEKNNQLIAKNERIVELMKRLALSDLTRVVEETGILDQEEAPLRKQESKHD